MLTTHGCAGHQDANVLALAEWQAKQGDPDGLQIKVPNQLQVNLVTWKVLQQESLRLTPVCRVRLSM